MEAVIRKELYVDQEPNAMEVQEPNNAHNRVTTTELLSQQNPALARLANAMEKQTSSDVVSNYSRMHHRHNRS